MIETIVLDFRFSFPLRNGGAKFVAVRKSAKFGGRHLRESPISKVLLKLEPRHVAKFRKFRFKNVEKSGDGKI